MPTWFVTGGAGFIGGNFVLEAVAAGVRIVNLDALTYAGNRDTLAALHTELFKLLATNHSPESSASGGRGTFDLNCRRHVGSRPWR